MRFLLAAVLAATSATAQTATSPGDAPRNVVLMIADGFGPASATLGRAAKGRPLALDSVLVGSVETSATDSRVTDSAAAATAFACGTKTTNGAVGVDTDGVRCRTILEAAEARGMATGLVATSRITHATPAAFAAHVASRADEPTIAAQMLASGTDVLIGGGTRFFTPTTAGGSRADGRDLLAEARAAGWAVATDRTGFDALTTTPALALLAPDHLAYEIDRQRLPRPSGETDQPSLAAMALRALDLLAASADGRASGVFLMVEGSRIDHAGHANDPAAHLRDILAYDAAVAAVLAWAAAEGQTLVVSTADHETGGMTLGRDGLYAWSPAPLLAATASLERMTARIAAGEDPVAVVQAGVGADALEAGVADALRGAGVAQDAGAVARIVRDLEAVPAGIGWTTGGHTAVDVGLYAWGPGARAFHGAMTNDGVGRALFTVLGLTP